MDNESETAARFRQRVKAERDRRGWTQTQLAEKLSANGIRVQWSAIAKLESGARRVRLDEAAAIADTFGTSLETLMGRRPRPVADLRYQIDTLLDAVRAAAWHVPLLAATARERATELADADSEGIWTELADDALAACDVLDVAVAALGSVGLGQRPEIVAAWAQLCREQEDSNGDT
jgi:transcriptional regulator with XRE-family HTH domain